MQEKLGYGMCVILPQSTILVQREKFASFLNPPTFPADVWHDITTLISKKRNVKIARKLAHERTSSTIPFESRSMKRDMAFLTLWFPASFQKRCTYSQETHGNCYRGHNNDQPATIVVGKGFLKESKYCNFEELSWQY